MFVLVPKLSARKRSSPYHPKQHQRQATRGFLLCGLSLLLSLLGTLTEPEKAELTKEFKTYDKNGDDKIDEAELRAVIEDPHAHDLKQMMEALASDMEDGKITRDQWDSRFETFAISMLTDNGEVLRFPEEYEGLELPFKGIIAGPGDEEDLKHDEL